MIMSVPKHFVSFVSMHGTYKRHSAFDHTLNFVCGENMVALHDKDRSLSPFGIRLNVDAKQFEALKTSIQTLTIEEDGVTIDEHKVLYRNVFQIDHDLNEQTENEGILNGEMLRNLYLLVEKTIASHEKSQDLLHQNRLEERTKALQKALSQTPLDLADVEETVQSLIGLGPGLTPSGDDILAGMLAGLLMQGDRAIFETVAPLVFKSVKSSDSTSMVSRQFLLYATKGIFIGEMLMLHHRLLLSRSVDSIVDRIASMGHSSGIDYLKGLMLAISIGGMNHDS